MELPIGSMRDMATLLNISVFTRQQIQFLASGYTQGQLTQWGHEGVLQEVLGQGSSHEPAIIALAWDINELMGHLVCVIDPGSPHAWILRIVLAPDFIWLGLHFVGTECHGKLWSKESTKRG